MQAAGQNYILQRNLAKERRSELMVSNCEVLLIVKPVDATPRKTISVILAVQMYNVYRCERLQYLHCSMLHDFHLILENCSSIPGHAALFLLPNLLLFLNSSLSLASNSLSLSLSLSPSLSLSSRVDSKYRVLIGDFGLSRDIFESDYYRQDEGGHAPIKWSAPESLHDRVFTKKSDIVS